MMDILLNGAIKEEITQALTIPKSRPHHQETILCTSHVMTPHPEALVIEVYTVGC